MRRFAAMVAYVPGACLPPGRRVILAVPVGAALLFGLLTHAIAGGRAEAFAGVADGGLFGLVLPLGALIIGDAVLGAEVRTGALHFTWLSPVRPGSIVVARWFGAWLVAMATLVPACVAAALIAGVGEAVPAILLAAAPTTAAHLALFVLLGATTRRAAVWSLALVLLGERLLGAAIDGIAGFSPTWVGRAVYAGYGPETEALVRDGVPGGGSAIGRLALIAILALAAASWRIGRLQLTGARD